MFIHIKYSYNWEDLIFNMISSDPNVIIGQNLLLVDL